MFTNHSIDELHKINSEYYRIENFRLCKKGEGLFDSSVDMAYIITMDKSDRKAQFIKEITTNKPLHTVKIVYNKGFKDNNKILPERSSNYDLIDANRHIFMDASANNYKNILVFEDDVQFTKNYDIHDINNINIFINNNTFDIYNIGPAGIHILYPCSWNFNHYRHLLTTTSQSIIYNRSFIDEFFKHQYPFIHIDLYHNKINFKKYSYHKQICYQLYPETENQKKWLDGWKQILKINLLAHLAYNFLLRLIKFLELDKTPKNIVHIYTFNKCLSLFLLFFFLYLVVKLIKRFFIKVI